jgi:hypothetical protein
MQLQLNMVDSTTLRDAMIHPENYKNLLVRISGYNAHFVELTKELQMELIERSQFADKSKLTDDRWLNFSESPSSSFPRSTASAACPRIHTRLSF